MAAPDVARSCGSRPATADRCEAQNSIGRRSQGAEYLPRAQELVREALEFAIETHAGQLRRNGDPVITHPLHAAETIAALQLDAATIAGALLHDVQEDCDVTQRRDREALRAPRWR